MFKLLISVRARKELKELKRLYQEAIIAALEEIKDEPLIGKPLTRELTGRFAYKVGSYRIIYKVNEQNRTVRVITAGHRSVVYN